MKRETLVSDEELEGLRKSVRQIRADSSASFDALPPLLRGPSVRIAAERLLEKAMAKFAQEEKVQETDLEMLRQHLRPILFTIFEEEFAVKLQ